MFYFFERDSEYVRCELRPSPKGQAVDLVITEANQTERVERFADVHAAAARWAEITSHFALDGWAGPFGRP